MRQIEKCFSCGIVHERVECDGIWHCPNALCRGVGAAWFRYKLISFIENYDGTHSVDEDEWEEAGRKYNTKECIYPEGRMKYRFEITYSPKEYVQACKLLKRLDLDIDGVAFQQVVTFSCENNLKIEEVKKHLTTAFESDEGKVLKIEGGKIE